MEALQPLTISRTFKNAPTVLLTADMTSFVLYTPLNEHLLIQDALLKLICEHFKINRLRTGFFAFQGKKYYCVEEVTGTVDFSTWQEHLWSNKRKFNQFIEPTSFFKMALLELFYPIFGNGLRKLILPGLKNQGALFPMSNYQQAPVRFAPTNFSQLGFTHPAIKRFFSWSKEEVKEVITSFNLLNHEKFLMDLKYQLSFYPNWRNVYWDEIKKCSETSFQTYASSTALDYYHRLGVK